MLVYMSLVACHSDGRVMLWPGYESGLICRQITLCDNFFLNIL